MRASNQRSSVAALLAVCLSLPLVSVRADVPRFEKVRLAAEYHAEGASVGDFNKDGALDIVCGPLWYEGPRFETRHRFYDGKAFPNDRGYADNFFSFAADFNGDGWQDIFVIGLPGTPGHWYENPRGEGAWTKRVAFPTIDNEAPVFADLTGDGRPELVCGFESRLGYAVPRADGEWTWHPISEKGSWHRYSHGLGVGDINGDGRSDFLMPEGWWEQPASLDGDPVWNHHPFRFCGGGAEISAWDVDGDGDNDVVTSLQAHGYGLSWFEHEVKDGAITFKEHRIMGAAPGDHPHGVAFSQLHALVCEDVDGDGLRDIVTGKCYWAHNGSDPGARDPAVVYWFRLERGDDGVRFVPHLIDDDSGVGRQIRAVDVDGDGRTDVVAGNKKGAFLFRQVSASVEDAIARAHAQFAKAMVDADLRGIMDAFSFEYVHEARDGSTTDRGPWRRVWQARLARTKYERVDITVESWVEKADDQAVLVSRRVAKQGATAATPARETTERFEEIWEKTDAGWQMRYQRELGEPE